MGIDKISFHLNGKIEEIVFSGAADLEDVVKFVSGHNTKIDEKVIEVKVNPVNHETADTLENISCSFTNGIRARGL